MNAEHGAENDAGSWVSDYDGTAPVDKSLFPDQSIGNCPGCSNVALHAKACPWLRVHRAEIALRDMLGVRFPSWEDYRYDEFTERVMGIFADALTRVTPSANSGAS